MVGSVVATVIAVRQESPYPGNVAWDGFTLSAGTRAPIDLGRTFEKDSRRYLWGGPNETDHFDITHCRIDPARLKYGIGRETFPALIEPEFESVESARKWLNDNERILAVRIGDEVKVYPVNLLIRHEVVNDVVGGRRIFAAYCILADLGAVYDRQLGNHTFTFALSGYTYSHPYVWDGRDAFVLWDRETESLWWPPAGKAVSGPMIDMPMKVLENELWTQTIWGEFWPDFPGARVLKPGQDFTRPVSWNKLSDEVGNKPDEVPPQAIPPRWGENKRNLKTAASR